MLHLYVYPEAQASWTAAKHPMTREQLDDSEYTNNTAYDRLAEFFNNYNNYFQNQTIKYEAGAAIVPFVAEEDCDSIAAKCWDLNPSNSLRPVRDGEWIKKVWKEMRSNITKVILKFFVMK